MQDVEPVVRASVVFAMLIAASTSTAQITEVIDVSGDGLGNLLRGATFMAADGSGNVHVSGQSSNNVFRICPEFPSAEVTRLGVPPNPAVSSLG